jgi:hypothetical protein
MSKMPIFALVVALAACGGHTSLDQRSAIADAVATDAVAVGRVSVSFDGQFDFGATEDLAGSVRRAALQSILADTRAGAVRRVYGCNYSLANAMVRWSCEDSGSFTAEQFAAAMLYIDPNVELN